MIPQDQIRLVIGLLLTIPLSFILSFINSPKILLSFSILSTICLQVYVYGEQSILLWVQQHIVYILCKLVPRKKLGFIIFFESFLFLASVMIRRMYLYYDQYTIDITGILMMQTFLYVGFAFNYQDGETKIQPKQNVHVNQHTIYNFPSYFYYLGYVFFLPAGLIGPVFQYKDFQNYINRQGNYKHIPNTLQGVFKQLKITLIYLFWYAFTISFPYSFVITNQFASSNFAFQFVYILISGFGVRAKYYAAWSVGMISLNASGFTFNGRHRIQPKQQIKQTEHKYENKWDRVVVSGMYTFEIDPSLKKKAQAWNMSVQLALRRYIYNRIYHSAENLDERKKKKLQTKAQFYTFLVSAIWHGFYPGYFMSFFHWMLSLHISHQLFRASKESQKFQKIKDKLYIVQVIFANFYITFFGICFALMIWDKIFTFIKAVNYVPIMCLYILYILVVKLRIFKTKIKK